MLWACHGSGVYGSGNFSEAHIDEYNDDDLTFQQAAKLLFDYNPETGELRWRINMGAVKNGDSVKGDQGRGYRRVNVDREMYQATHLIWLIQTGRLPKPGFQIDHIDRNPRNNCWSNLREVTPRENCQNKDYWPAKRYTLTDRFCTSPARVPREGRVYFHGSIVPPMALQVAASGYRSFVLIGRFPNSKHPARRSLGRSGAVTLEQARAQARDANRVKGRSAHVIPLAPMLRELLESLPRFVSGDGVQSPDMRQSRGRSFRVFGQML